MITFVANLKPYTFAPAVRVRRFSGFLLSTDYAKAHGALAKRVTGAGRLLVADNGNFDRIEALAARYRTRAEALAKRRESEERKLGHRARPKELSGALASGFRALAEQIAADCRDATSRAHVEAIVAAQHQLRAGYLIGMEDLTIPLLLTLGLEREHGGLPLGFYAGLTERALRFAEATRRGAYGPCGPTVFAGLHAVDRDTAEKAGRLAAASGVDGIAVGLGAALGDPSHVDYRVEGRRVVAIAGGAPRAYLRVAEIAAGLFVGHAAHAGRKPRLHALGVGTPILLPLLALLGDGETYLATDSTAPIKDGASSKTLALYVDRPAPMKLKAYVIAERWLEGERGWTCACPHCRAFVAAHPFRLDRARRHWAAMGRRPLTPEDLWAPSALAEFLPLLGAPKSPEIRRAAATARVGHNHWILQRLERASAAHDRSLSARREWAQASMEAYVAASQSAPWQRAVREAWRVLDEAAVTLEQAAPSGPMGPQRT